MKMLLGCSLGCILIASLIGPITSPEKAEPVNKSWRNPKDGMDFVWIPAGRLLLEGGTNSKETQSSSAAQCTFTGFWLGRTEVTIRQFHQFVRETRYVTESEKAGHKFTWKKSGFQQREDHPAVYLSALDVAKYVEWAGVDLPTEAEWIYACRAGTVTRFYWGEKVEDRFLWHRENSPNGTHPVARTLPNPWGLFDMIGNVREYVRICGNQLTAKGESWTRCTQYRMRDGRIVAPLNDVANTVLTDCHLSQPSLYPFDDDRGFRCIKRPTP